MEAVMPTRVTAILFPSRPREFRGERWVNIGLRCVHLTGVAGIGGGFLFQLEPASWAAYWHLTLASGLMLSLIYLWSTAAWLFELKGLSIVLKNILLGLALALPTMRGELFVLIIVLSGLIAHAPARVRSRRWFRLPPGGGLQR
jgi:hypothetical protein